MSQPEASTVEQVGQSLLELEAEVFRDYWSLLSCGMPLDWTLDERKALVVKLQALRDAEGAAMVQAELAGDIEEFTDRHDKYVALELALTSPSARPPAAPATRSGGS